ncbi:MAG: argininosuccinate lyase [Alphaproteobacteria bacterium]|nr:MAG: argininosuccinate lyase [Alphaproteobacteria bacterium]TAF14626.1 MAG: argininosuccinate lyase [Alphaproteobacteria bacterium]TAF41713.1 MAG: argininosuccinate lyase [Alphaproteobacteria bacterium]TAF75654.1 MAG: argininosuccinate lyase [Alphaproteobacteria bacterium]
MNQKNDNTPNAMWGGHYSTAPDSIMQRINCSVDVDHVLYAHDIAGSIAHVTMLGDVGIISKEEANQIRDALPKIAQEIADGQMVWNPALEDIHMHVEMRLKELIGEVAGKLHTARSRNDQVVTDLRLYVMEAMEHVVGCITSLQRSLCNRAEEYAETIMAGCTHFQPAQPVTLGHHLMAYVEMLERDKGRMRDARRRMAQCPLGAAALAGTSFPIDRHQTAKLLGFLEPTHNSLDSVASRDFVVEASSSIAMCAVHLSRFAEELVMWSSPLLGWIHLPEQFTTGSSIMPQKRNPDAAELIRAKTGRCMGHVVHLLTLLKGTPLAYNKDLQEDKEPIFDAIASLDLCLSAMRGMVDSFGIHAEKMEQAARAGHSTATDLADWLVRTLRIPFREAHHITGRVVVQAEQRGCALWELPLAVMQTVDARITQDALQVLDVRSSVASRTSYGGTSPRMVRAAIVRAREVYGLEE